VVQESINNIIKHSEATSARVEITRTADAVIMEVSDNGKGFLPGEAGANGAGRSFGLTGMAERVRMLDGDFSIQSAPRSGTTIKVRIDQSKVSK
jgi:signal transduction histidine kinase